MMDIGLPVSARARVVRVSPVGDVTRAWAYSGVVVLVLSQKKITRSLVVVVDVVPGAVVAVGISSAESIAARGVVAGVAS